MDGRVPARSRGLNLGIDPQYGLHQLFNRYGS
jgi:hypothetical protein